MVLRKVRGILQNDPQVHHTGPDKMQDFRIPVTETQLVFVREKQSPFGEISVGTTVTGVFLMLPVEMWHTHLVS